MLDARFCAQCGRPLAREQESASPSAEFRLVTLLFCDVVDSVGLSSRLDPEDYGALILAYRETCTAEVTARGGHILQYLGDGVLACFGYPAAHEDDAVRALNAGLAILEAMGSLNQRLKSGGWPAVEMRAAAHTDLVMAGDLGTGGGGRDTLAVVGGATNIASRLHHATSPGRLVVSNDTWRAVRGFFIGRPLGALALRGLARPVEAHEVLARSGAVNRLEARAAVTRFCGRRTELESLRQCWNWAGEGSGQAVLLRGEAGVGKSRLLRELTTLLASDDPLVLTCQCLAEHQTSALQPLVAPLSRLFELPAGAGPEAVRSRLDAAVSPDIPAATREILIAGLQEILLPQGIASKEDASPQLRRQLGFSAMVDALALRARRQRVLLVVEDLHWADDSTLSLLDFLLERLGPLPLLVVMTARPEFRGPVLDRPSILLMELQRLPVSETEAMVTVLAGGKALPPQVRDEIVSRTEGVPLFIEELTSTVLESGQLHEREDRYELAGPLLPLVMPQTLQGSLMARLDRVSTDKPVAQLCAALGRSFSLSLAQAVARAEMPPAAVAEALERLTADRFLNRHVAGPDLVTYTFRHALIQEAAYESLLRGRRRVIHRRIAEALSGPFAEDVATRPEVLANHLTQAGMKPEAVEAWERAGRAAAERSAGAEAATHFRHALSLLEELPASVANSEAALRLHIALGTQYLVSRGNGAPEVQEAFDKALALSQGVAGTPVAFRAIYGLQTFYIVRGQLGAAQQLGRRMTELAASLAEPGLAVQAQRLSGLVALYCGDFATAQAELRGAWSRYKPERDASQRFEFGSDPGTLILCALAWTLWFRGHPEAALAMDNCAVILAERLKHPHSQGFALSFSASLRQSLNQPGETLRQALAVIALAERNGFPYWAAWGEVLAGWAVAAQATGPGDEDGAAGLARLRRGLADFAAMGGVLVRSYGLLLLADAQLRLGQFDEAARDAAEGLAETRRDGVRFMAAELHRLHGEALYLSGAEASGIESLAEAVRVASAQGSPMLEQRAIATLLLRLPPDDPGRAGLEARQAELAARAGDQARIMDWPEFQACP